jgi:hypothetical protein
MDSNVVQIILVLAALVVLLWLARFVVGLAVNIVRIGFWLLVAGLIIYLVYLIIR